MSRRMLRGLVLETRDHGERDAVVTIALREELVRVFARGVQRETSKNRRLCLPFEEVEIETEQSGTGMRICACRQSAWRSMRPSSMPRCILLFMKGWSSYGQAVKQGTQTGWEGLHW